LIVTNGGAQTVQPSHLIEKIRDKIAASHPSTAELVSYANELILKYGLDYSFDWEPKGTFNERNLRRLNNKPLPFTYAFRGKSGNTQRLRFMNASFAHPCFSVIDVPVRKVTANQVTLVTSEGLRTVNRPKAFDLETVKLLNPRTRRLVRKWIVPIDSMPVGISADGRAIYFDSWEFSQDERNGYKDDPISLAVELNVNGTLRFVSKSEIPSDKGVDFGYDKKHTEIARRRYHAGGKTYIVEFSAPCT
jgi:hypothetical protein